MVERRAEATVEAATPSAPGKKAAPAAPGQPKRDQGDPDLDSPSPEMDLIIR
jgi:hypothetical protein